MNLYEEKIRRLAYAIWEIDKKNNEHEKFHWDFAKFIVDGDTDDVDYLYFIELAGVYNSAYEVFEGIDAGFEWLNSPRHGLNNTIPLDYIKDFKSLLEVKMLLGRIEHGVF